MIWFGHTNEHDVKVGPRLVYTTDGDTERTIKCDQPYEALENTQPYMDRNVLYFTHISMATE